MVSFVALCLTAAGAMFPALWISAIVASTYGSLKRKKKVDGFFQLPYHAEHKDW